MLVTHFKDVRDVHYVEYYMGLKLETSNGWTEAVINDNCEFEYFYRIVNILKTTFDAKFDNKIHDFGSIYWDFEYNTMSIHIVL